MNKSECIKFVGNMTIAYPNFFKIDDENKVKATVELWFEMMEDIPYNIASLALKKHIANQKYPPSISEIRTIVSEISKPEEQKKSAEEAWIEVQRIVRNYSWAYNQIACKEAMNNLGAITNKAVEYLGYHNLWNCDIERDMPFLEKRFKEFYQSLQEREIREDNVPLQIKQQIQALLNGPELKVIAGGLNR